MKKQIIRLTEGDLHKIIKESVKQVIMENAFADRLEQDLHVPIEARISRMTDEEIMQVLNQIKTREMVYDQEQLEAEREMQTREGMPYENPNLRSSSAARAYTHGMMDVPLK